MFKIVLNQRTSPSGQRGRLQKTESTTTVRVKNPKPAGIAIKNNLEINNVINHFGTPQKKNYSLIVILPNTKSCKSINPKSIASSALKIIIAAAEKVIKRFLSLFNHPSTAINTIKEMALKIFQAIATKLPRGKAKIFGRGLVK